MTNLPGILVLAFAKAQLIQMFFFRLNLVITLLGMAHGLVFLPVLLSYFGMNIYASLTLVSRRQMATHGTNWSCPPCFLGPGVNKAVLLQQQNAKKDLEMKSKMREMYDNISYLEDEIKQEPDSNGKTEVLEPSEIDEKEVRIDSF